MSCVLFVLGLCFLPASHLISDITWSYLFSVIPELCSCSLSPPPQTLTQSNSCQQMLWQLTSSAQISPELLLCIVIVDFFPIKTAWLIISHRVLLVLSQYILKWTCDVFCKTQSSLLRTKRQSRRKKTQKLKCSLNSPLFELSLVFTFCVLTSKIRAQNKARLLLHLEEVVCGGTTEKQALQFIHSSPFDVLKMWSWVLLWFLSSLGTLSPAEVEDEITKTYKEESPGIYKSFYLDLYWNYIRQQHL